jgi:hypothetical protein
MVFLGWAPGRSVDTECARQAHFATFLKLSFYLLNQRFKIVVE